MRAAAAGAAFRRRAGAREASLSSSQRRALAGARGLAHLFDDKFNILGFRFGVDSIVGLIPFVGDATTALSSAYLVGAALKLRLPPSKIAHIALLVGADFLVGLIPVAGDLIDMLFKAHLRSVRIIEKHIGATQG